MMRKVTAVAANAPAMAALQDNGDPARDSPGTAMSRPITATSVMQVLLARVLGAARVSRIVVDAQQPAPLSSSLELTVLSRIYGRAAKVERARVRPRSTRVPLQKANARLETCDMPGGLKWHIRSSPSDIPPGR